MKEQLKSIQPYKPGKQIEEVQAALGLKTIVKLASNENPFGSSPKAIKGIHSVLNTLEYYPDGHASRLREAAARHLGVSEEQIIFGNGSDELIHLLSRAILQPGMNAVMADTTFGNYKRNVLIDGAEAREVPLVDGCHDLDAMLQQINENTGIVWLCNPNNPTGEYIREQDLLDFLNKVPESVIVACDEAYNEYAIAADYPRTIDLVDRYPNLFITRTFSKAYGLAGLRIGLGVGDERLIRMLEPAREPFNASQVAQVAALYALEDKAFIESSIAQNREGLQQYYDFCEAHDLKYFPSQANFILIDFGISGEVVFNFLLQRGYIVRSGVGLGCPTGVRITVGTDEQNSGVMNALQEFLDER